MEERRAAVASLEEEDKRVAEELRALEEAAESEAGMVAAVADCESVHSLLRASSAWNVQRISAGDMAWRLSPWGAEGASLTAHAQVSSGGKVVASLSFRLPEESESDAAKAGTNADEGKEGEEDEEKEERETQRRLASALLRDAAVGSGLAAEFANASTLAEFARVGV